MNCFTTEMVRKASLLGLFACLVLGSSTAAFAAVSDADITRERAKLQAFYSNPVNVGVDLDSLARIKAEIAAGEYDRACTAQEHDATQWHMLIDPVKKCHYDHHHGDDPNLLNNVCAERPDGSKVCFGQPGAWYGKPGNTISYPWQTFMIPATATNPYITPEEAMAMTNGMENQMKHEGYTWIVRRNQPCQPGTVCTTDFRVQLHSSAPGHDGPVRFHSISFESRICRDPSNPKTCGIARDGGWEDFGILVALPYDGSFQCGEDDSAQIRNPANQLNLPNEQQFDPITPIGDAGRFNNSPPGVDDRFRCHNSLTPAQVQEHIRNGEPTPLAQWWGRDVNRFQMRFFDPAGNLVESPVGSKKFAMHFYCEEDPITGKAKDPACRMNGSKFNAAAEYTFTGLAVGNYAIEIVDDRGVIIGTSASIAVAAGATVSVTVTASAAAAIAAAAAGGGVSTALIITTAAIAAGVIGVLVAKNQSDASASR